MVSNVTLGILLSVYVVCCIFFLWFCVIADPSSSQTAYFLTVTCPNRLWFNLSRILGKKNIDVLSAILDRALVFVYLAVVLGAWTVVFWYIYPWISESPHVWDIHRIFGYFVFVACCGSWRLASKTSPGIITAQTYKRYDHFPYDNLLFVPNKRCESTNLVRLARSKFDRLKYNQNVPRYDHYCGWVYNTIGEDNYRWFLLFLSVHVFMCAYGSYVCILLFRGEIIDQRLLHLTFFDRATGETFRADWFIIVQYLFALRMPECAVLSVMFVMCIALASFLGYHLYLTSYNMTTNESTKWADIKDWYKKQKKKYDQAVKDGLINPSDEKEGSAEDPAVEVSDGDVTCTPGTTGSAKGAKPRRSNPKLRDPGPVPKNIYDRGFVENWKEVIFPLSLRNKPEQQVANAQAATVASPSSPTKNPKKPKNT